MNFLGVVRILGLLIALFSITLFPPVIISLLHNDGAYPAFLKSLILIFLFGIFLWAPTRTQKQDLRFRDGFIVVVLIWVVLSMMAAIPFLLLDVLEMRVVDAIFESTSGLTTTGATVLIGLDSLPHSILYYRQQLQWLGGMGIIVLAVAVLPALGVGGMQLYRAESPGPVKDNKLTPRITETAKAIWYIYLGLTIVCGVSYYLAGMSVFDSICHAFSTVAIGGFSTHDASLGYFQNSTIYLLACLFMLLAGINFALHFAAVNSKKISVYLSDPEARVYMGVISCAVIVVIFVLTSENIYSGLSDNWSNLLFSA